jgi:HlyD family secretion protein
MNYQSIHNLPLAAAFLLFSSCGKKMEEIKPIRKDVTETVFASGILEAGNTYSLTAQADGYLVQVNFDEGNIIAVGKILAVIDNKEAGLNQQSAADLYNIAQRNTFSNAPALLQAQNSISISKQKMELDLVNLQRYQKLWAANSIARADLDNAELQYKTSSTNYASALESYKLLQQQADQQAISTRASKNINTIITGKNQIRAVVAGKIFKKYKQTGDYVKRGETIALIGNAQNIYAKVNVDEGNIGKVKVGQEAVIQLNTIKNKTYKGRVAEIYPSFDEGTQSFTCKLVFTDSLDFCIVNTQLQCNIIVGVNKNALLIPRNYLDFGGNVQVKGKKGLVKVTTQFVSNEWVQVLSGIDENTTLVTDNIADNKTTTSEAGSQIMH